MTSPSNAVTQAVTLNHRAWTKEVLDGVTAHNPLYQRLAKGRRVKTESGGRQIAKPIAYAEGEYQRYVALQALSTEQRDTLTSSVWDWRQVSLPIAFSGRELRMNMGPAQIVNLVSHTRENTARTAANQFSIDMYSDGTEDNQIGGLQHLIQPNGAGVVGGIDGGVWEFWRNQYLELSGTNIAATPTVANSQTLLSQMNLMNMATTRGADKVDMIPMSHDLHALYEVSQQDHQRYAGTKEANAGFESYKYKGADVFFDENTNFASNAERAYFLNTDYLYVVQHPDAAWTIGDERKPTNQDGVIMFMLWMGAMLCTNRARQGLIEDVA